MVFGKTAMNLKRFPIWSGEVSIACADLSCALNSSLGQPDISFWSRTPIPSAASSCAWVTGPWATVWGLQ